jgi:cytochrome c oxidase assembly protein Cox11
MNKKTKVLILILLIVVIFGGLTVFLSKEYASLSSVTGNNQTAQRQQVPEQTASQTEQIQDPQKTIEVEGTVSAVKEGSVEIENDGVKKTIPIKKGTEVIIKSDE